MLVYLAGHLAISNHMFIPGAKVFTKGGGGVERHQILFYILLSSFPPSMTPSWNPVNTVSVWACVTQYVLLRFRQHVGHL